MSGAGWNRVPRIMRTRHLLVLGSLLIALAILGCGGDDRDSAATRQSQCIILDNGNKLCGQDAKTYCREFQSPDVRSKVTCDTVLDRPPPEPTADDFSSAKECRLELGEAKCSELGFLTPERQKTEEDRAGAEDAFEDKAIKAVGENLYFGGGDFGNVGELERDGPSVTLFPDLENPKPPPKATRQEICRRILKMPEVEKASWDLSESGGAAAEKCQP